MGGRTGGLHEFKASLVYRLSSRTAKATQRNLAWKGLLKGTLVYTKNHVVS